MRILRLAALLAAVTGALILAADWPMQSGNPQRNGWARSERYLKRENVSGLKLLYKYQADNVSKGFNSLTPPIINGNLITYRGFKEMLIFGGSSDKVYSVDADLNKILWEFRLEPKADPPSSQVPTAACSGGLTAPVIMAGSSSAPIHFTVLAAHNPAASGVKPAAPAPKRSPYFPPLSQTLSPLLPTTLTQLAALYAVSSDGMLHVINSSTGGDLLPPFKFLSPNAKVTSLNIRDNVVYATTADNCDGNPNTLYALDLLSSNKKVATFVAKVGNFSGAGGTTIGNDGTVYVQTASGPDDSAGKLHETIYALTPKDLRVKDYFTLPGQPLNKKSIAMPGITPLVFSGKGKDMLVAGGRDGRLYLLESTPLGGPDHHTPLFQTEVIASRSKNYDGNGFRGTFSSWSNVDINTRWIYAPLYGPPNAAAHLTGDNAPSTGSIVAFKLEGTNGQSALQPLWISHDLPSPTSVVIASDMVFALSTGESLRIAKKNGKPYSATEWQGMSRHATLYAFDALTGHLLYSSGSAIPEYSHGDNLAVANGRVYFTTYNNTVYCFGFPREQTQLAEQ